MAWDIITSTTTLSSGAFDITGLTLTGYKVIRIELSGHTVTTDGTDHKLTFYVSGSEVTGTAYQWATFGQSTGGGGLADSATGAAALLLVSNDANNDTGNASTKSLEAEITVMSPADTSLYKIVTFRTTHIGPTGNALDTEGVGIMQNAGAIDGIKISGTSNLTAGKVVVVGLT